MHRSFPKGLRMFAVAVLSLLAIAGTLFPRWGVAEGPIPMQGGGLSLEGGVDWINTDRPIHLDKLKGKIVLLDFWTYCCINCHHVLPDLARLEAKYKNQLVVIGVHTAKFPAEKVTANIRKKVAEYKIKHPVVNDADQVIWTRFGVNSWPTIILIDAKGQYVGRESGEGFGDALDKVIGRMVTAARARGELDETPIDFPSETEKTHKGGLLYPGKITADAKGNRLFISDTGHNRIVITDLKGTFLDAIGNGRNGLNEGDYKQATFDRPQGTCLVDDTLYVADTENHAIRAVDLKTKSVKTVAGTGKQAYNRNVSGKGIKIGLNSPWDVLLIPGTRSLAIAMAGPHQIWQYNIDKDIVGSWAGSGIENIVDGSLNSAAFAQPSGLATDGKSLFVADSEVSGVRAIDLTNRSHRVQSIVGQGLFEFGDIDGKGPAVRLQHCLGLAFGDSSLYIADTYNNKIKICDPASRSVTSFVGTGKPGIQDNPAQFDEPGGISLAEGVLFVADTNNHAIRAIDIATRRVATVETSTIKAPAVKREPTFANAATLTAEPVKIVPGSKAELAVALALPTGYKLSADAPLVYKVESVEGTGTIGEIESPVSPFTIPIVFAKPGMAGEKLSVRVSLQAFVCLPNTLCTIKNYVMTVPVTFEAGASSKAAVSATATAP